MRFIGILGVECLGKGDFILYKGIKILYKVGFLVCNAILLLYKVIALVWNINAVLYEVNYLLYEFTLLLYEIVCGFFRTRGMLGEGKFYLPKKGQAILFQKKDYKNNKYLFISFAATKK